MASSLTPSPSHIMFNAS
ncbi:hypothetical protein EE612_022909 [Oryza sativa]|nr:hypothetical protein EE612_022909 [Oryza sativa]